MEKLIKTAKNFGAMAKGTYWTCMVCAVLIAVGAMVFAVVPDTFYDSTTTSLIFGPVQAELNDTVSMDPQASRFRLVAGLILTEILVLAGCYAAKMVGRIMEPMTQGKPFDSAVSANLKKLAMVALIAGGLYEVSMAIVPAVSYGYYDLYRLFNPEMVTGVTVEYRIDLWFLLLFGILQLASYVFRYGEELQQLSDETL